MKSEHKHEYRKGRGSVDVCACGRFRHNEKAGPAIVEQQVSHTPGPWRVEGARVLYGPTLPDIRGNGTVTGIIAQVMGQQLKEHRANASLIAAAPQLLDTLEMALGFIEAQGDEKDEGEMWVINTIRATIANVKGGK